MVHKTYCTKFIFDSNAINFLLYEYWPKICGLKENFVVAKFNLPSPFNTVNFFNQKRSIYDHH